MEVEFFWNIWRVATFFIDKFLSKIRNILIKRDKWKYARWTSCVHKQKKKLKRGLLNFWKRRFRLEFEETDSDENLKDLEELMPQSLASRAEMPMFFYIFYIQPCYLFLDFGRIPATAVFPRHRFIGECVIGSIMQLIILILLLKFTIFQPLPFS